MILVTDWLGPKHDYYRIFVDSRGRILNCFEGRRVFVTGMLITVTTYPRRLCGSPPVDYHQLRQLDTHIQKALRPHTYKSIHVDNYRHCMYTTRLLCTLPEYMVITYTHTTLLLLYANGISPTNHLSHCGPIISATL
jgi:hypothetical protein